MTVRATKEPNVSENIEDAFRAALAGGHDRAVAIPNRWLQLLAQNNQGRAALVIGISLGQKEFISEGRGFDVKTERGTANSFVRLTSTSPGLSLLFLKLAEVIAARSDAALSKAAAKSALVETIDEFRLFGTSPRRRLSESEVRGLFAELMLLRDLLHAGLAPRHAIGAWRGPFALEGRGIHDFVFGHGQSIEVKSTRPASPKVVASSESQLVPTNRSLYLTALPLERGDQGISLRALASELGQTFGGDSLQAHSDWIDALDSLGVDFDDEWYEQFTFHHAEWAAYEVRDGFPAISADQIPIGILDVRYSIDLARIGEFSVPFTDVVDAIVSSYE